MASGRGSGVPSATAPDGTPYTEVAVDPRLRDRMRLLVCCLALTALAVCTEPGLLLADTKIDMVLDPGAFLGRALHLWDTEQFGQLQNQAAGYFVPMGPFYWLGHAAGMPAWIVQRLWFALLMCAALLGVRALAARLETGGPTSRLVAGMAYALSPHALSALGQNSWEYLPLAMLPWTVVPLATAAKRDSGRLRAAARSGLAIGLCGGINGTATVAVLAVPFLFLLTRPRGVHRFRLLSWWTGAVACAVAWWLVPLVLTGRYGFSWLGYTEQADTTTATTGLVDVLRGTERWINYLPQALPVGGALAGHAWLVLITAGLAAFGLAGLVRRDLPDRTFPLLVLLAGVAIVAAGHASRIEGPLAPHLRDLLDGPLAPLRNLYKFDGMVRLPMALGIAHLPGTLRKPRLRAAVFVGSALTLVAVATPAMANGLAAPGAFPDVPQYWRDAASWLNKRAGTQSVLALPGSRTGSYTWGRPMDDVIQPLLRTGWGARQMVPQGSPGYARMLDAIDQRVAAGRGSPGLSEVLARSGVRYLLIRNDLSRGDLAGAWPGRVHQALDTSPGVRRVAAFGDQPGGWSDDAVSALDQKYPAVEIYQVDGARPVAGLLDASGALRLRGGPEGLLDLADAGDLKGRPVLVGDDASDLGGTPVASDAARLRDRSRSEIRTQIGPTLTAGSQPDTTHGLGPDPGDPAWDGAQTVAEYSGIKNVTASSSASDPGTLSGIDDPAAIPYAAVDRDPDTQWITGGTSGPVGQWLRVDLPAPLDPGSLQVTFTRNDLLGPAPTRVAVETERGTKVQDVRPVADAQTLEAPPGPSSWLRLRILAVGGKAGEGTRVGVRDLSIPGVTAERYLRLPAVPAQPGGGTAPQFMGRVTPPRPECMRGSARWVCSPELARGDEDGPTLRRVFTGHGGSALVSGQAVVTDPELADKLTRNGVQTKVTASSSWTKEAPAQPRAAVDGDPSTAWIAAGDDKKPSLTLAWGKKLKLDELTVTRPPGARSAMTVTVLGTHGEVREGLVGGDGKLRFAPMRTDRVTLRFATSQVPVQVAEVAVPGVPTLTRSGFLPFTTSCGTGPDLTVNGRDVKARITGTVDDVLGERPVTFRACGAVPLANGDNRISAGGRFRVDAVAVDPDAALATATPGKTHPVTIESWGKGERRVQVTSPNKSFLVVNENFNSGWKAETANGGALRPVRLDGWRQGFEVPAGTSGTVTLRYAPDTAYRGALFGGLGLLALLVPVSLRRRGTPPPPPAALVAPRKPGVRSLRVAAPVGLAAALGFWLAGPVGLAVAAVSALVGVAPQWSSRQAARRVRSAWIAAFFMLLGGASVAAAAWMIQRGGTQGDLLSILRDVFPQICGLAVLGRLTAALTAPDAPDAWLADGVELRWSAALPASAPAPRSGSGSPPRRPRSARGRPGSR
ncbi:alpha-(1-_3)-arabinofuranosyltransferase domain-containing protein [Actinomadura rupiterrae]|uniref:alpha-(1->3)-arabinofuranosyltransferase domain-containing protein n=1 Tax=Actinomadura rupiterrae TaxID=559627 RepID=UPI0020A5ACDF|nr:alpha-(1->3)-arabinofuranosyltransferase family protein [Actinomadura rupiterrae]MCP2335141.1 arabinofuranan 3-O-arabinosyltransferase [Actinomadura rupiterrae]